MTLATVLQKFERVKETAPGKYMACCTGHDDRTPSLGITETPEGKVLLNCGAGCSVECVLDSAGLTFADLFPEREPNRTAKRREVARYDYADEDGVLLYRVVRFDPKDFRQQKPEGDGWSWSVKGVRKVPYRLPELLATVKAGGTVFVVEGEKDVNTLRSHGLTATCNAGGAKKWTADHAKHLKGADVVVIPDNDQPGAQHAELVAKSLRGIAKRVRVMATLPSGKDVTDWFAAGGTAAQLRELADSTLENHAVALNADAVSQALYSPPENDCPALDLLVLARTDPRPPQYKVDGLVPERATTLLSSHGGAGKSMLALYMAVCLAAGIPFFGVPTKRSYVLFYSCEDDRQILHWRLHRICKQLGVDLAELEGYLHVHDMTGIDSALFAENPSDPSANLTARYSWLNKKIIGNKIDVLIVDNASDAFDANEIHRAKVRRFIQSLVNLVRNNDGAVLLLAHVDKASAKTKNADGEAYSGSTAWHNSVRSRLYLDSDGDTLTLNHGKLNHGKKSEPITLRWTDSGTLESVVSAGTRDSLDLQHIDVVLGLLREFEGRGEYVAASHNSPTANAYKMFHAEPNYPKRLKRDDLFTLLRHMQRTRLIDSVEYVDSHRKHKRRLTVVPTAPTVPT